MAGKSFKRRLEQWAYHQRKLRKMASSLEKSLEEVRDVIEKTKKKQ